MIVRRFSVVIRCCLKILSFLSVHKAHTTKMKWVLQWSMRSIVSCEAEASYDWQMLSRRIIILTPTFWDISGLIFAQRVDKWERDMLLSWFLYCHIKYTPELSWNFFVSLHPVLKLYLSAGRERKFRLKVVSLRSKSIYGRDKDCNIHISKQI
jgi:hypothetical protein